MITVENLSFTYRKSKRVVLHDFSLAFESGRVYAVSYTHLTLPTILRV